MKIKLSFIQIIELGAPSVRGCARRTGLRASLDLKGASIWWRRLQAPIGGTEAERSARLR